MRFLKETGELLLSDLSLRLRPHRDEWLLECLRALRQLNKELAGGFSRAEPDGIMWTGPRFKAVLHDPADLYALGEVLLNRAYSFWIDRPHCVWDVGMNIGAATLFFAASGAARVYGYEPVQDVYSQAIRNIDLNPQLAGARRAFNCGIGKENCSKRITYSPSRKLDTSTTASWQVKYEPEDQSTTQEVHIRDAREVVAEITAADPDKTIVAKLDCEGAEYEIIEALHASGQLRRFAVMIVEWHGHWPQTTAELLVKDKFVVCAQRTLRPSYGPMGMLYACRTAH
jgi:FkbM family methyltransferase